MFVLKLDRDFGDNFFSNLWFLDVCWRTVGMSATKGTHVQFFNFCQYLGPLHLKTTKRYYPGQRKASQIWIKSEYCDIEGSSCLIQRRNREHRRLATVTTSHLTSSPRNQAVDHFSMSKKKKKNEYIHFGVDKNTIYYRKLLVNWDFFKYSRLWKNSLVWSSSGYFGSSVCPHIFLWLRRLFRTRRICVYQLVCTNRNYALLSSRTIQVSQNVQEMTLLQCHVDIHAYAFFWNFWVCFLMCCFYILVLAAYKFWFWFLTFPVLFLFLKFFFFNYFCATSTGIL